jgi:O-antigen/teichoic acid export membrane protein
MKAKISAVLTGDGMKARAIRGTALSICAFGGSQLIRLGSNLILTRLLFPEAFGLMALMQVFIIGLEQFADMGIHPAIIQSKRGDERAFLNTAWSFQVVRGFVLWLLACLLTVPLADFYEQESLKTILPILALSTVLSGLKSTKLATANRHLMMGRFTIVELASQILGTIIMIIFAFWLVSVWALVIGSLSIFALNTIFSHLLIPGANNKLELEKKAGWEIFHFGKFIIVSTIAGYFVKQGDRLVLGKYVTLEELAIFTIAYLFGSLSLLLNYQVNSRIIMPLYRQRPPVESASNYYQIGRARVILIVGFLALTAVMGLGGEWLVETLYDPRYHGAGPMLVLLSVAIIPSVIVDGCKEILLANGNSRSFTIFTVVSAVVRMVMLLVFIQQFGIIGAIIAPFLVEFVTYPLLVYYIRPYRGWYPLLDMCFIALGAALIALVLWASPAAYELLLQPFL